jgi:hypothetical protein
MKVKKLEFRYREGAGDHIYAHLKSEPINCVEFTMKGNHPQPILKVNSPQVSPILIGYDMWIQFPPVEWDEMVTKTFKEMVDAWNEKYAVKDNNETKVESSN